MRAAWVGVYDRGNLQTERVHFRAILDIDLVRYVLSDTTIARPFPGAQPQGLTPGNTSSSFWFPTMAIRANENVVVYTRAGIPSREARPDGSIYHFIFRGLAQPLYGNPDTVPVLFEVLDWSAAVVQYVAPA
jgi:hypothetical protein